MKEKYCYHLRLVILIFIIFLSNIVLYAQSQAPRLALIIGNSTYNNMPLLKNPVNDAQDIADSLRNLGFSVTLITDGNRKSMNQAIVAFRELLAKDRESEGVYFFAGHGVQSKGINYLIPVNADIKADIDLEDEAISVQKVLGSLEEARNKVNLVILDACRDNPLVSTVRTISRGLAVVGVAPPETVIVFSTGAGQTASDGDGRNSPFAKSLLAHLADIGDITKTIKQITGEVKKATGGDQTPYIYSNLSVDFELNKGLGKSVLIPIPQKPNLLPDVVNSRIIYETDFSIDPQWNTNNSSRYYWDSSSECFYSNNYTNSGDRALRKIDYNGESFRLLADIMPTVRDTGDVCFGIFDSNINSNSSIGRKLYVLAGGYSPVVYIHYIGNAGESIVSSTGIMKVNKWHHVEIIYDSKTKQISLSVSRDWISVISWKGIVKGGLSSDMDYIGITMNGSWSTSGRHEIALIDNVLMELMPY